MPQDTKKVTREEKLAKARQYRREMYDKLKKDPEKYAAEKERERLRYLQRKEDKKLKFIEDLTPKQRRLQRRKWRESRKRYVMKKQKEKGANLPEVTASSGEQISQEPQELHASTSKTNDPPEGPNITQLETSDEPFSEASDPLEGPSNQQLIPNEKLKPAVCTDCNIKTQHIRRQMHEITKMRNEIEKLKKNLKELQRAFYSQEKERINENNNNSTTDKASSKAKQYYCNVL